MSQVELHSEEDLTGIGSTSQRPIGTFDSSEQHPSLGNSAGGQAFDSIGDNGSESLPTFSEIIPAGQVCKDSRPNNSELVGPKLTFKLPQPHRSHDGQHNMMSVDGETSKQYHELVSKFTDISACVYDGIKESDSYSNFYIFLGAYGCNVQLEKVQEPTSWKEMFDVLSSSRAWDCLNYHLLREIFERYFPKPDHSDSSYSELEVKFNQYDEKVRLYLHNTKLLDFLDVYAELFPVDSKCREGCKMLKVKFEHDLRTMTLEDFHTRRGYIKRHFRLRHYALFLIQANDGCVILYWFISEHLVFHLKKVCTEQQPDFGQAGVIEISIDDYVLYQAKNIQDIVEDENISPVSDVMSAYDEYYDESIKTPEKFWSRMAAKELQWDTMFTEENVMKKCDMSRGIVHFFDGTLNASVNCLDRHAELTPHKVAIIWEKNNGEHEKITYQLLLKMTCQLAHVLRNRGIQKNDIVLIYMSSSPIAVAAMLACTRIGAIHSVAYAVLNQSQLEARIRNSDPKCILTSDMVMIGEKSYSLKSTLKDALKNIKEKALHRARSRRGSGIEGSINQQEYDINDVERAAEEKPIVLTFNAPRDEDSEGKTLEEEMKNYPTTFEPVSVEAEHTMFIMYTSGTTANSTPVGIKHCTAGYLLYVALSHKYVFDYKPGDVFGCMSAIGWITGHSYVVYGPLCNGATTVLYEGTASYPNSDRFWKAISDHKINQFYITPSTISQFMREAKTAEYKDKYDLSSLKTIATVGEPLKNSQLIWILENIGHDNCKFVDTWWQTETGGIALIVDHAQEDIPEGSFPAKPFFGVHPVIIDPKLKGEYSSACEEPGFLCLKQALPGMGRGITECEETFEEKYFQYKGHGLFTHDLAIKLESGGFRITGRNNNAIRIQGVWLDVASIEDQMSKVDERIMKAALLGIPDKSGTNKEFEYEGVCVLLEMQSEEIDDDLIRKVEEVCTDKCFLPQGMSSDDVYPGVIVLPVYNHEWLLTRSGKTITVLYQKMVTLITSIWTCTSAREPFKQFCKKFWSVYQENIPLLYQ